MPRYLNHIDMTGNQIKNAVMHRLASDPGSPAKALITPPVKCAYGGDKHASRPRQAAAKVLPTIPVVRVMQSALVGSFRILKLEYARRIAPE